MESQESHSEDISDHKVDEAPETECDPEDHMALIERLRKLNEKNDK